MKKQWIKINDWYYPMASIMLRINKHDRSVSLFTIGSNGEAEELVEGKQAEELIGLLDELSFEITGEDNEGGDYVDDDFLTPAGSLMNEYNDLGTEDILPYDSEREPDDY